MTTDDDFLEPMTPAGAKEFADRWLIGEAGTDDRLRSEAAEHIYSLLRVLHASDARPSDESEAGTETCSDIQFSPGVSPAQHDVLQIATDVLTSGGRRQEATGADRARPKRAYVGACPECGSQAGLHALSCSRYPTSAEPPPPLSEAVLSELRALPASQWEAWPPDEADQGLPLVELRQDHLAALLAEVEMSRRGR